VLLVLAVLGMLTASAVAVGQPEVKRLLAYSSVAQVGYMVLGSRSPRWRASRRRCCT
jgi:multicomponent Na+:H+ antiporter subunit D